MIAEDIREQIENDMIHTDLLDDEDTMLLDINHNDEENRKLSFINALTKENPFL